ncbi:hypothetical protein LSCM1_06092 [Leishmania martiniquensis]|uniref:Transmembrane protein n=1 Tax=Leishmania martiniquensis TaxID=1580590 RepID=A0A836KUI6_9TRYP|nr:hypothetical protein LSCM1_06092 [Leishmania martiniquensis]
MRSGGGPCRLPSLWQLSHTGFGHLPMKKAIPLRVFGCVPQLRRHQHSGGCNGTASLSSSVAMRWAVRDMSSRSATSSSQPITPADGGATCSIQHQVPSSPPCPSAPATEAPHEVTGGSLARASSTPACNPLPAVALESAAAGSRCARGGERRLGASHTGQALSAASIGKSKHKPHSDVKIKKRAPWGAQQLRDSWSEDAMTKRDRDNMDERIHREYRYHPDEFRRYYIRYTVFLTLPCIMIGMSITYYLETGRPFWQADPQHLLNLLRVMDTSPRSKLYAYRLPETHELPAHVLRHRSENAGKREYEERVFRLTHSAFERPSADVLRLLELEELAKAGEVAPGMVAQAEEAAASNR